MPGIAVFSHRGLKKTLLAGAGLLALVSCISSAYADDIENVVVTARRGYVAKDTTSATKSDIHLIDTQQSVSVITQDHSELLQVQNLEQATRYTAGVISGSYGPDERFDWITLRGFTPTQYLDGVQLPTAAIAEAQARFDTYGLEQIEILKGPSSALYGAVPPGGLVSMISKRPQAQFSGEVDAQIGNYNHYQLNGDVTGPIDEDGKVLYRLTGLWRDTGTQVDHVDSKRVFVAPALTWNIAPSATLTLLSHYQKDDTGTEVQFLPAQGTLLPNPNGHIPTSRFTGEPNYDSYKRSQWDVGYDFDYAINSDFSLHQNLKYTQLDVSYRTIYSYGLEADLRTLDRYTYDVFGKPHDLGLDNRAEWKVSTGPVDHEFLIGLDYRNSYDNTSLAYGVGPTLDAFHPVYGAPVPVPAIASYQVVRQSQTGIYVQDHASIGQLSITGSGRQDWVDTSIHDELAGTSSKQNEDALSARIGANYVFESGVAPYVQVAKSFVPSLGYTYSGASFQPTTAVSYEGGIKFQPAWQRVFVTLAAYHLVENNALTPDPNPAHIGFSVQTGQVTVKGVELEGVARLNDNLSLNASYAYTDAKVTKSNDLDLGKYVPLVPMNQASFLADYTITEGILNGFGFGGGVRFVGSTFGDSYNVFQKTPSYTLFDAILHYDTAQWHIALNANNLFDKEYVATCYSLQSCQYGSRRTVFLTVGRRF
jgi:iron complex outermembrane receptor protein